MATWQDVAAKVAELAPIAGATLGGPLGGGIGLAIKALAGIFGITSANPQPQEVMTAITADPQAALKLETARFAYQSEVMKEETERLQIKLADVQDARKREVEIIKATGKDWDKRFLTLIGVIGPQLILWWVIIDGFPNLSTELTLLVGNLMGLLFAKYSTIFDYHLGTSIGSNQKNADISALIGKIK